MPTRAGDLRNRASRLAHQRQMNPNRPRNLLLFLSCSQTSRKETERVGNVLPVWRILPLNPRGEAIPVFILLPEGWARSRGLALYCCPRSRSIPGSGNGPELGISVETNTRGSVVFEGVVRSQFFGDAAGRLGRPYWWGGFGCLPPGRIKRDQHQHDRDGCEVERWAGAAVDLFELDRAGLFAGALEFRNQHAEAYAE